ncbi:MAG: discoidin domain-containing protein [Prevotella sp.]|jgi:hypothetical protein|nr:discoidin domain-containing protein [Prevotella sp.]
MKSLSYILLAFLLIVTYGCKEEDHPYVGYITVGRVVVEATAGSATVTAETDISEPITMEVKDDAAEWCTVSATGKQITVTVQANSSTEGFRTATVSVRCGYRVTEFTVLQKFEGQQYLEYDWAGWEAKGSDVQASDGGGYGSLFTEDRTTFWHSQYSPALTEPLPHRLDIDMKKELSIAMVRIGRRYYAPNGNNYPTVKTMEVYTSTDNVDYTKVGGFTFALPWTAPDGTVVNGNSPLVPGYEDIMLPQITTARYVRLVITETNNTAGTCQVSYFKAFEKI